MNLSHAYGEKPSEADAVRLLNHALDAGVTMLDTAALYGGGDNERLLGNAVMHRRHSLTLTSKCVLDMVAGKRVLDGSPTATSRTVDAALQRLGIDHIDLYYYPHRLDPNVPIEESVDALALAKETGKIGAIGLSGMSAAALRRAHAVHPIAAMQTEYSPWGRNAEVAVLAACREFGVGFVTFSPLARGLLAGGVTDNNFVPGDIRAGMPRFQNPNFAHNLALAKRFNAIAADAGCTSAQLSLGWLLSRAPFVVPIPGTRRIAHFDENVAAASIAVEDAALRMVDELFEPGGVPAAAIRRAPRRRSIPSCCPKKQASDLRRTDGIDRSISCRRG